MTVPKQRYSKDEFREQWIKAREDIALALQLAASAQGRLANLYEGVLAEEAPEYRPLIERAG